MLTRDDFDTTKISETVLQVNVRRLSRKINRCGYAVKTRRDPVGCYLVCDHATNVVVAERIDLGGFVSFAAGLQTQVADAIAVREVNS